MTSPTLAKSSWRLSVPGPRTWQMLFLASTATFAGIALGQPSAPRLLAALAGVVLAMGAPGLAMAWALFPRPGLGRAERLALVLGLQLSVLVASGFLLHVLPAGLSVAAWGAILANVTLLCCGIAWVRDRRGADGDPSRGWQTRLGVASAPTRQLMLLLGAVMLVATALLVARMGVVLQPQEPWTALSIVSAQDGDAILVGVKNAEGHAETYRLVITVDGDVLDTIEGLSLGDGAAASSSVPIPKAGAFLRRIGVSLWRAGDPEDALPYRSVSLSSRGVPGP